MSERTKQDAIGIEPVDSRHSPISEYEFLELLLAPMELGNLSRDSVSIARTQPANPRAVTAFASVAAISFLLFHLCGMNFCDPDMWHEMALFRQSLLEGRVPTVDRFAYNANGDTVDSSRMGFRRDFLHGHDAGGGQWHHGLEIQPGGQCDRRVFLVRSFARNQHGRLPDCCARDGTIQLVRLHDDSSTSLHADVPVNHAGTAGT